MVGCHFMVIEIPANTMHSRKVEKGRGKGERGRDRGREEGRKKGESKGGKKGWLSFCFS